MNPNDFTILEEMDKLCSRLYWERVEAVKERNRFNNMLIERFAEETGDDPGFRAGDSVYLDPEWNRARGVHALWPSDLLWVFAKVIWKDGAPVEVELEGYTGSLLIYAAEAKRLVDYTEAKRLERTGGRKGRNIYPGRTE